MTSRLLAFIRWLREHGVRVSVAESLDALYSVRQVGIHDRELLRLGLRTALVKSHHDFATFDTLFERFFTAPRRRKRRRGQHQQSGSNGHPQRLIITDQWQPRAATSPAVATPYSTRCYDASLRPGGNTKHYR